MKMAKANEADLQMASELCGVLELLGQRWAPCMPEAIETCAQDETEPFDRDNDEQCGRALRHLLDMAGRASLSRVVYGMAVLLDPRNKVVDPAADTLEHHPAMLADGARLRWLTEDHADLEARARCREILARLPAMGHGAASRLIDDAMAAPIESKGE